MSGGEALLGPIALFCIMMTLFFGALFDKVRSWGLPVPASIGMIIFGAILGAIAEADHSWRETLVIADFNADLILHIFLPVLIFDGSAGLKLKVLTRVTTNAIFLAGPGVIAGAFSVAGLGVALYSEWSFLESLLLGAVVAATDPVAVIAVLHDLEADPFVSVLVDGEAIMNDGAAIVLFQIVKKTIETGIASLNAGDVIGSIFRFTLMPIPMGIAFGWVIHVISLACLTQPLIAGTVQLAGAYIMFYVSDHLAKTSGVLTLLIAGIFIARQRGRHPRSDAENDVRAVWNQLVWVANTLLFALAGFLIVVKTVEEVDFENDAGWKIGRIFLLYLFLNAYRFVMFAAATPLINYTAELPEDRMTWERYIMLSFAGLRGGVGATLALSVLGGSAIYSEGFAAEFFLNVAGVVILSSFLNGWLAGPLVDYLKLNSKEIFSFYALRLALQELKHNMNSSIEIMKRQSASHPHTVVNWVFVRFMSVNRVENLTLHVEHEAKTHGSVPEKDSHIDAAAKAAMAEKDGANNNNNNTISQLVRDRKSINSVSPQLQNRNANAFIDDNNNNHAPDYQQPQQHQEASDLEMSVSVVTADNDEPSTPHNRDILDMTATDDENTTQNNQQHQTSQQIENEGSCSVFMFCKTCCKANNDSDDDTDDEDGVNDYRNQQAEGVALDERSMGFGVNRHPGEDDNMNHYLHGGSDDDEDAGDDDDKNSAAAQQDLTIDETVAAVEAVGTGTGEALDDSFNLTENNDNNNNRGTGKIEGLPSRARKQHEAAQQQPSHQRHNIAADRAIRNKNNNNQHPRHVLANEVNIIKNAELKALKIVELLNQSKERHIMTPIVLRMIKRDLWRQYNDGLLTGTTVTAFSEFIDSRTRTGLLFTTADVFAFIKQDCQLSLLDKCERFLMPNYFSEQRQHFLVEAAIAFKTMMEHVKKTLPLLHAKQANIIYWMGWAKLTYSCAVDHERDIFEQFPEVAVLINSRRSAQDVLSQARSIVPVTAAMYGLTTHQKKELHDKMFDFAYDALVIKEKDSIIHRIREDALRAGQDSMKEVLDSEEEMMKTMNTTLSGTVHRTKIDADAAHGKQLIELLKNTAIFYSATDELLAEVVNNSHAQFFIEHEPIVASECIGFVLYGNISRLTTVSSSASASAPSTHQQPHQQQHARRQQQQSRKTKRFHSGDFFGIQSLVFNNSSAPQQLHFIANEETQILWIPYLVARQVMENDARVRHHFIINSAFDVVGPLLSRAYPFAALTTAQRRSIINQAKVTRVVDPRRPTDFGPRDAVFILRGRETLPPSERQAADLLAAHPHMHEKTPNSLASAPSINLLPEGYNGFFEVGTILIQLHDARLTSQRVPLTGMTFLDIANLSLDVAWTSFTETAKQRDAFEATDVLLQELHKYVHICAFLKSVFNKMIEAGVSTVSFARKNKLLPAAAAAAATAILNKRKRRGSSLGSASGRATGKNASESGAANSGKNKEEDGNESDVAESNHDDSVAKEIEQIEARCKNVEEALAVVDEGDAILVVRDCMDELAKHIRIWSLQKHQGSLNRLYVSHVLSAFFSLVVRRADQWVPRVKQFVEESYFTSHHHPATTIDWSNIDSLCTQNDLANFLKDNSWYTAEDLHSLNAWSRLNVEGNIAINVDIDEPPPALISATLHDSEKRTAIFHAKSRAKLVTTALRDMPSEVRETINKQRLFGRARVQVSRGRSLPGGTSGLDVIAPLAQSERNADTGTNKSPSSGSDVSFNSGSGVATERSVSDFYRPDNY